MKFQLNRGIFALGIKGLRGVRVCMAEFISLVWLTQGQVCLHVTLADGCMANGSWMFCGLLLRLYHVCGLRLWY
jgi:hypothetical protein